MFGIKYVPCQVNEGRCKKVWRAFGVSFAQKRSRYDSWALTDSGNLVVFSLPFLVVAATYFFGI